MQVMKFTIVYSENRAEQMWIRQRLPQKPKQPTLVVVASHASYVSSHANTSPTAANEERKQPPEDLMTDPSPKPPHAPKTAVATQKAHVQAKEEEIHKKKAHKRATLLYSKEHRKGKGGMSARKVEKAIKKSHGWAPLATAFETFIRIKQLNGQGGVDNTQRSLMMWVNEVVGNAGSVFSLFKRLIREIAIDLLAAKSKCDEERRILWTTYNNLKMWFQNWERDLIELGFAEVAQDHPEWENGEVFIPPEQMNNIINSDEMCLSLDGSEGVRGGQPEIVFFDPNLPNPGKDTSKSSKTTTIITGSTAAGEALPPHVHFQFQTDAKTDEGQRYRNEMIEWMLNVRGKYGGDAVKSWPCTFGMNAKGGMDDAEFYICYKLASTTLAESKRCKRTSSHDEDPKTELVIGINDSAFERGFSVVACKRAWENMGAAPLTRKCMSDKQVCRKIGDAADEINALMRVLREGNRLSVQIINRIGYNGDLLKVTMKEVSKTNTLTEPHLKERIALMAKAKTHSAKFTATGG
ncbi:hypothetical protein ACHAWF_012800 [Thalassiosira exigua]